MLPKHIVLFLQVIYLSQAVPNPYYQKYNWRYLANQDNSEGPQISTLKDILLIWINELDRKIADTKNIDIEPENLKQKELETYNVYELAEETKKYSVVHVKAFFAEITQNLIPPSERDSSCDFIESDCFWRINASSRLQPLILTPSITWPSFDINEAGLRVIPKGNDLLFICPRKFMNFPENYVTATCHGGIKVRINGKLFDYSDIKCTEEVKHFVNRTGQVCYTGDTEKVKISYKLFDNKTIDLYEICMEKFYNDVIYTKYYMKSYFADGHEKDFDIETSWYDRNQFKMDFTEAFNCTAQTNYLSAQLGRDFHTKDRCCFYKRQLVSHRDLPPGVAQRAAFSYMNISPQWSTCNYQNWEELELRVRNLAKSNPDIHVITGTKYDYKRAMWFEGKGFQQHIPNYLWKVVIAKLSFAVIQINVPDLTPENTDEYILCPDICDRIEWMKGTNWTDVTRGYIYCCSIEEFENAFLTSRHL